MLCRFLIIWGILHLVLLIVEIARYYYSNTALKLRYHLGNSLWDMTYLVIGLDVFGCMSFVSYLCYNFITKGVLL